MQTIAQEKVNQAISILKEIIREVHDAKKKWIYFN